MVRERTQGADPAGAHQRSRSQGRTDHRLQSQQEEREHDGGLRLREATGVSPIKLFPSVIDECLY